MFFFCEFQIETSRGRFIRFIKDIAQTARSASPDGRKKNGRKGSHIFSRFTFEVLFLKFHAPERCLQLFKIFYFTIMSNFRVWKWIKVITLNYLMLNLLWKLAKQNGNQLNFSWRRTVFASKLIKETLKGMMKYLEHSIYITYERQRSTMSCH